MQRAYMTNLRGYLRTTKWLTAVIGMGMGMEMRKHRKTHFFIHWTKLGMFKNGYKNKKW